MSNKAMRIRAVGAALAAMAVVGGSDALACSCPSAGPAYEWQRSEAVFSARVVGLTLIDTPVPAIQVELTVIEVLKGTVDPRVVIYAKAPNPPPTPPSGAGDVCEFTDSFRLGGRYLISAFANRRDSSDHVALPEASTALITHFCSATSELTSDSGRRFYDAFRDMGRRTSP